MESSQNPLPGSWISATFLFMNKFKTSNTLLNSTEYTITRGRLFLYPCLKIFLGHSNRWTHCIHQEPSCGVQYTSAERAEKLLLLLLYSCLLCGSNFPLTTLAIKNSVIVNGFLSLKVKWAVRETSKLR
jgi:hypothetical protein